MMRWLVALEDDPRRTGETRNGIALIEAATADGLIASEDLEDFAKALIDLREEGKVGIAYPLLDTDQGPEVFVGQPEYHFRQVGPVEATAEGRASVADPQPTDTTFNISGSSIGQIAGRDINTSITLNTIIEMLDREIDDADAPEAAKEEARDWIRRIREALRIGGQVAQETGIELLARIAAQKIGLPPG